MMRLKYILAYIIVFFVSGSIYSQGTGDYQVITNREIFSKLIEKNLEKLENHIVLTGKDKVFGVIINAKEEEKDFLYTKIRQKLHDYKIISETDTASADYILAFDNIDLKTKYNRIFGSVIKDRKVEREISVSFDCRIQQKNSADVIYSEKVKAKNTDDFRLDNLEQTERSEYEFTKGTLPERSVFEKALVPGIAILASAITIILFFVIRSK